MAKERKDEQGAINAAAQGKQDALAKALADLTKAGMPILHGGAKLDQVRVISTGL